MVTSILQNINLEENQARDVLQPNRKMCSDAKRGKFLSDICYKNDEETMGQSLSTFER